MRQGPESDRGGKVDRPGEQRRPASSTNAIEAKPKSAIRITAGDSLFAEGGGYIVLAPATLRDSLRSGTVKVKRESGHGRTE